MGPWNLTPWPPLHRMERGNWKGAEQSQPHPLTPSPSDGEGEPGRAAEQSQPHPLTPSPSDGEGDRKTERGLNLIPALSLFRSGKIRWHLLQYPHSSDETWLEMRAR